MAETWDSLAVEREENLARQERIATLECTAAGDTKP